jgi:hypothetical protein
MSAPREDQISAERPPLPVGLTRGAVLVVDDVEANLTAMDALLADLGC